jgi:hypothetical protein
LRLASIPVTFAAVLSVLAAGRTFTSYASVKPILTAAHDSLPAELKNPDLAQWTAKQPRIRVENITEASKSGALRARSPAVRCGWPERRMYDTTSRV